MAIAFQPPPVAAQQAKEEDRIRRLNSIDPIIRHQAREESINNCASDFGKAAVAQANKNAKAYQDQLRYYERMERENSKYKPLPPGTKNIIKGDN